MAKADIQRTEISGSSNVASAGWCSTRNCLDVGFADGSVYRYHNVSAKVWEDFQAAPSKGKFVHGVLKQYQYEKLDGSSVEEQTAEE